MGFGEACLAPAAYSLITDLFAREHHGRALATFTLASIVGAGGSFILGAQALGLANSLQDSLPGWAPWRLTFMIVGARPIWVAGLIGLGTQSLSPCGVGGPSGFTSCSSPILKRAGG